MHQFGSSFGKSVGKCLRKHSLEVISHEVMLHCSVDSSGKSPHPIRYASRQGSHKVGKAQIGLSLLSGMLLAQHRQAYAIDDKVVAIAIGVEHSKYSMCVVASLECVEHGIRLLTHTFLLFLRFAGKSPGVIEVEPVDVRA